MDLQGQDVRGVSEAVPVATRAAPPAGVVHGGAELAASLVPPAPSPLRRALARVGHLWLLAVFLVLWQVVSVYGQRINPQLDVMLPPPTAVVSAAAELLQRGVLLVHVRDSLYRVLLAVGAAALLGIPLGLGMGASSSRPSCCRRRCRASSPAFASASASAGWRSSRASSSPRQAVSAT
jgi:hypothetical protein